MRHAALLLVAATAATTLLSCNFNKKENTYEAGIQMVEIVRDSMQHGICLGINAGGDSLHFLDSEGDTLWLTLNDDTRRLGQLNEGDQVALMVRPVGREQRVKLVINTSMLIGEWVEDDPIANENVKGYLIGNGGAAEGINLTDLRIEGWALYNGRFLLSGSLGVETFTDTFTITRLTPDSFCIKGRTGGKHFLHRMRPGEANYASIGYSYEADPTAGDDFHPGSKDLDESPELLGDDVAYSGIYDDDDE